MKLYRVLLNGEGFELSMDGGSPKEYGFWRNVYVLAVDVGKAKTKARLSQMSEINREARHSALRSLTADDLIVDSVEVSYEPWKLIFREGFAFHPVDKDREED